jgi:ArsR family transcriptional regulator, arsenate/arsenite/antimonite-responsive transcriptional repressor
MTRRPTTKKVRESAAFSPPAMLGAFVEVAKALGHPARLRMVGMLRGGELCVCQLTSVLRLSGSTVSAHLSDLRRARLVAEQKRGKWVYYRLSNDESMRRLINEVLRLLIHDPQLREDARVIEAVRTVPVDDLCRAALDLTAVGVTPRARASAKGRTPRHVE